MFLYLKEIQHGNGYRLTLYIERFFNDRSPGKN